MPHHVVSTDVPDAVRGRAVVCEAPRHVPRRVRGPRLPHRLRARSTTAAPARSAASRCRPASQDGSRLPEPIFTPATKAALGDHDENVVYEAVVDAVGDDAAAELRMLTLAVYGRAEEIARERGIILADTKLEFGARGRRHDRCWPTRCSRPTRRASGRPTEWQPGRAQPSYDKQIVRDWLTSPESGWDRASGEAAAAAARRGRRAHPRAVRRGLRAAHRGDVLTAVRATVELPVPVEVVFDYLSDPRNRPEWQASLRSVTVPAGEEPHLGQRWQETTAVGVRPRLEIIEMDRPHVWTEAAGGAGWRRPWRCASPGRRVGAASTSVATSVGAACGPCPRPSRDGWPGSPWPPTSARRARSSRETTGDARHDR